MEAPPVHFVATDDGHTIAYSVCGGGPPLLLMPVLFNHQQLQWDVGARRRRFESLAAHFRLIRYDSRGQGMSSRGLGDDLSLEDYDLDLKAVVEAEKLHRFVLFGQVGFSHVAIRYAATHPDQVAALILWNTTDDPSLTPPFNVGAFRAMASQDWEVYLDVTARTGYPSEDPQRIRSINAASVTQSDWLSMGRVLRQRVPADTLAQVSCPTLVLVVQGVFAHVDLEAGRRLAAKIPNARILVMQAPAPSDSASKPPQDIEAILDFLQEAAPVPVATTVRVATTDLSAREVEVLRLLAAGRSNQQVADSLVISLNTVRRHVSNIFGKIGAANRADAVSYAHRQGLV
jgi:DNA-binding CsgD family transcriptional regulator/pimeloyl-ACP methyl ester carboxylesterase